MTQRERIEDLIDTWRYGLPNDREAVIKTILRAEMSFVVAMCRVMAENLGETAAKTEMRALEIKLSEKEP